MHLRTNMGRFFVPKIKEKQKHDDSNWHQTTDRFLDRLFKDFGSVFGSQFGAMSATVFCPKRPRRLPRRFQDGPRRFQKRPGWPKMAQDASKPAPELSRPRFGCLQAWILMAFWQNADPFLDGFGIVLTMQIPSRLHVFEASKAFSKLEF